MAYTVVGWVRTDSPAAHRARLVLFVYADLANVDGSGVFCGLTNLVKWTRLSRRAAQYGRTELEVAGALVDTGRREYDCVVYDVSMDIEAQDWGAAAIYREYTKKTSGLKFQPWLASPAVAADRLRALEAAEKDLAALRAEGSGGADSALVQKLRAELGGADIAPAHNLRDASADSAPGGRRKRRAKGADSAPKPPLLTEIKGEGTANARDARTQGKGKRSSTRDSRTADRVRRAQDPGA